MLGRVCRSAFTSDAQVTAGPPQRWVHVRGWQRVSLTSEGGSHPSPS
jgi:hypothetical protein